MEEHWVNTSDFVIELETALPWFDVKFDRAKHTLCRNFKRDTDYVMRTEKDEHNKNKEIYTMNVRTWCLMCIKINNKKSMDAFGDYIKHNGNVIKRLMEHAEDDMEQIATLRKEIENLKNLYQEQIVANLAKHEELLDARAEAAKRKCFSWIHFKKFRQSGIPYVTIKF